MEDWLQKIKAGDEVCVCQYEGKSIAKVYRTTNTMIITERGDRFSKIFGRAVGSQGYSRVRIIELTDRLRQEIEREDICSLIRYCNYEYFSIANLRKIKKIIDLDMQQNINNNKEI